MSGNQVVVAARPMSTRGMKWTLSAVVLAVAATFALSAGARPAERGQHGMGDRRARHDDGRAAVSTTCSTA